MHTVHRTLPVATDGARSVVFVGVGHTDVPCKNGRTDGDAVWMADSIGPGNYLFDGVETPHGKGHC